MVSQIDDLMHSKVRNLPRLGIITNGNAFSAKGLRLILDLANSEFEVAVWIATGLRKRRGNRLVEAARLFKRWGLRYTCYKFGTITVPAIAGTLLRRPMTVGAKCRSAGISLQHVRDVNSEETTSSVMAFSPDILISFSCPCKIDAPLLRVPAIGAINVHSSLLPAYAGVCTYVHVLARGETVTGITIHEMTEVFDAGMILAQEKITITPSMSAYALFTEQCERAAPLLLEVVRSALLNGSLQGHKQDLTNRSYFGEPTKEDVYQLSAKGHSLIQWRDISPSDSKTSRNDRILPRGNSDGR